MDPYLPPWVIFLPAEKGGGVASAQLGSEDASGDHFREQCREDPIFIWTIDQSQSCKCIVLLYLFLIILIFYYFLVFLINIDQSLQENIASFLDLIFISCVCVIVSCTCVTGVIWGVVSACILTWCVTHVSSITTNRLLICVSRSCRLFVHIVCCCCGGTSCVYDLWLCIVCVSCGVDDSGLLYSASCSILSRRVSYLISDINSWTTGIGSHSICFERLVRIVNYLSKF